MKKQVSLPVILVQVRIEDPGNLHYAAFLALYCHILDVDISLSLELSDFDNDKVSKKARKRIHQILVHGNRSSTFNFMQRDES